MENQVPDNLEQVKKLDNVVRNILKDKRKKWFWHKFNIWKNSIKECLRDGPSANFVDISRRGT